VPFNFRRKAPPPPIEAPVVAAPTPAEIRDEQGVVFDGLTEEWRLIGRMHVDGRLSDALNRRAPIAIADVQWAPADGSSPLTPAPGLRSIDPYDLIMVLAGEGTLPPLSDDEKAAHKVHKVAYEVALEVPPYRIVGTVFLFPGIEPEQLLDRSTEMFVPITDAQAFLGMDRMGDATVDVVLVNRFYLRGVEQLDKAPDGRGDAEAESGTQGAADQAMNTQAELAMGVEAERAMQARADAEATGDRGPQTEDGQAAEARPETPLSG
jgi:hypothetical protein